MTLESPACESELSSAAGAGDLRYCSGTDLPAGWRREGLDFRPMHAPSVVGGRPTRNSRDQGSLLTYSSDHGSADPDPPGEFSSWVERTQRGSSSALRDQLPIGGGTWSETACARRGAQVLATGLLPASGGSSWRSRVRATALPPCTGVEERGLEAGSGSAPGQLL